MVTIILGFFTAFIIVFGATPALIKVAILRDLVDVPGEERKLHTRRIPSIGGIIIFAGTIIAYMMWYPYMADEEFRYIAVSMLFLFFMGVKDDFVGTSAVKKLLGHLVVAFILVIIANIRITSLYGLLGVREIPEWTSILLSVFTYAVIVNAFNLIDGLDGLASGIGTLTCMSFGTWFYLSGSPETSVLAFALAGALFAFLIYNYQPAKIFMGDSGSLTVGLIISVLSIKLIEFPNEKLPEMMWWISKPLFTMAVLAYPLVDTLRIFIYRTVRGQSPFSADRNHIHHKFIDLGLSHSQTVLIILGFTVIMISMAVFIRMDANIKFVIMGLVVLLFSILPDLIGKKKYKSIVK